MENKTYNYEGKTIEEATEFGLTELGLTSEDVEIEIISKGGLFSKAQISITVKEKEIELKEEDVIAENEVSEELLAQSEARVNEFIGELIAQMGLECSYEVSRSGQEINVKVSGKGASAFIGYRGEVLDAIQYLTLWIANKEGDDFVRVSIDAEDYRQRRKETLTRLAERLAHKCHKTGRKVELEPMNPFERRVIHTALQNDKFVKTESYGEGRFRHVVILPKEEIKRERNYERKNNNSISTPEMSYGTSASFRKKGIAKTKSYGAPSKKPY